MHRGRVREAVVEHDSRSIAFVRIACALHEQADLELVGATPLFGGLPPAAAQPQATEPTSAGAAR